MSKTAILKNRLGRSRARQAPKSFAPFPRLLCFFLSQSDLLFLRLQPMSMMQVATTEDDGLNNYPEEALKIRNEASERRTVHPVCFDRTRMKLCRCAVLNKKKGRFTCARPSVSNGSKCGGQQDV